MLERFFNVENPMPVTMMGPAFDIQAEFNENEPTGDFPDKPFECFFEPIYRREYNCFVPAGHKVFTRLKKEHEFVTMAPPDPGDTSTALFRVIKGGISQIDIVRAQIEHFNRFKAKQPNQKFVFEINLSDLEANAYEYEDLKRLIVDSCHGGMLPKDFVVEISAEQAMDPGVVFTIAQDLRELGVMIALINLDADAFSFKRIMQVAPHIVKLNGSWFEQGLHDPHYLEMTRSLIDCLGSKKIHTAFTGVRTGEHLKFVYATKAIRAQGPFFGEPKQEMTQGPVFWC